MGSQAELVTLPWFWREKGGEPQGRGGQQSEGQFSGGGRARQNRGPVLSLD